METTTYKKLVVFDINLDWKFDRLEDRRYKDMPLVYSLIKEASRYQTVVIQTTESLSDAIQFANSLNLEKGYLLGSGGAIIYDLAKKEVIKSWTMTNDEVQIMVHHGVMYGLNVSIYTSDRKFMYVCNSSVYESFKDKFYSDYEIIPTYDLLQKTLQRTDIVDVGYLHFLGSVNNSKQETLLNNLDKYWENEVCNVAVKLNKTSNYVHSGNKQATKLKGIQYIMDLVGVKNMLDVLYIAASCVNKQCYISFKNNLLASNADFINEIGSKQDHKYLVPDAQQLDPQFGLKTNSFWK